MRASAVDRGPTTRPAAAPDARAAAATPDRRPSAAADRARELWDAVRGSGRTVLRPKRQRG